MSQKIKKVYLLFCLLFFFACQSAFAASSFTQMMRELLNKETPTSKCIKDFFKKIDFSTKFSTEYDSNIFLAQEGENSDVINTLTQKLSLKLPQDPFYLQLDYTGNLRYYTQEGDKLYDHLANFILSYRPFKNFSFGIGNYFKMMVNKKITTAFADRLLSRGYKEDAPYFEMKLEPTKKLTIDYAWQYYYLDATSHTDDYIDRGDNISKVVFNYEFLPKLAGFLGYRYRDAHFPHLSTKDNQSSRVSFGLTKKLAGLGNLTGEFGQEYGSLALRDDANLDAKLILESTFSVYTLLNLTYGFNQRMPSARSEYSQYFANSLNLGLTQILNPKTTLLANIGYERQKFDSTDALGTNPAINKKTNIISLDTTLRRRLNEWFSVDLVYTYTKRNTKFAAEGYTDNKVSLGLTANY